MLLAKDFPNQTAKQISIHRPPQEALGNNQSQAGSGF